MTARVLCKLQLACVVAVMLCANVSAQSLGERTIKSFGVGRMSCGSWLSARRWSPGDSNLLLSDKGEAEQWVLGYVSGVNSYGMTQLAQSKNVTEGTDGPGMLAWIDQYCHQTPLDSVFDAAVKLVNELIGRVGAK